MDPFGAGAALHRLAPPGHKEQGKDGARVGMNVTAHQQKEETKKGKRGAVEKKK